MGKTYDRPIVKIEIHRGTCEVTELPKGIVLEVFDHDNEEMEPGTGKLTFTSIKGEIVRYSE